MISAPDEQPPTRVRETPTWQLGQAALLCARLLREGFAAVDSSGYHYRLLATLDEFGPASQAVLGRRNGIDPSDVVAQLNELAQLGHVQREPDPDDRRRNVITITRSGVRQLRKLEKTLDGIQRTLTAPLSATERRQLVRLLTTLNDHHHRKH